MANDETLLTQGFNRLSKKKQAEILGMVEALTFAQFEEDKKNPAVMDTVNETDDEQ
jgi:hypothetical protein